MVQIVDLPPSDRWRCHSETLRNRPHHRGLFAGGQPLPWQPPLQAPLQPLLPPPPAPQPPDATSSTAQAPPPAAAQAPAPLPAWAQAGELEGRTVPANIRGLTAPGAGATPAALGLVGIKGLGGTDVALAAENLDACCLPAPNGVGRTASCVGRTPPEPHPSSGPTLGAATAASFAAGAGAAAEAPPLQRWYLPSALAFFNQWPYKPPSDMMPLWLPPSVPTPEQNEEDEDFGVCIQGGAELSPSSKGDGSTI
mmetsp:Transcript_3287/g.10059  ORF Transcript_3287/g.10059 Transcript_3287/m.10059 type:complete len:253 (+) Transcript_3287:53-811(+)|eukprot:CAMPEP_0177210144 /NCGR_PEP_ID=MMETSP0367-20130122/31398_1 /TAXON_ID=447022 ORGANISM="Scrippsiella hangoei-like, Strain SHHI-4" /NCGR_SAMPLE_ID=MMETSP0367 /ASSEMBLY_ACC=CAM_ASM_000362 /LENGTH=252 /DNA_ID=CAMNT_0018659235 /DNA_START=53 /DNA_END=811 /DNA_ORIENTATION=+